MKREFGGSDGLTPISMVMFWVSSFFDTSDYL